MTADEYAKVAQAAQAWQFDPSLTPIRRRLAQSLYELANQLVDPEYGCPTEALAVMAMYQHLQRSSNSLH